MCIHFLQRFREDDFLGGINYTHETYSNGPAIAGTVPVVFTSYGTTNRFAALTLGQDSVAETVPTVCKCTDHSHEEVRAAIVAQNLQSQPCPY